MERSITMLEEINLTGDPDEGKKFINWREALILPTDNIPEPIPILSIVQEGYHIPILNEDNISLLFGPAKARKSALVRSICQAIFNGSNDKMVSNYHRKKISIVDTEQSRHHCLRATKNIYQIAFQKHIVDYLSVTTYSKEDKKNLVESYLAESPDCGLMIIDNIVHFANDFNSATEAAELTQWLLKIKSTFNTHVLVVLHENPTPENAFNSKPRGHLGTNLMNLCETGLRIRKDPNDKTRSIISAALTRGRDFTDIVLTMDDQMIPYLDDLEDDYEETKTKPKSYH